MTEHYHIGITGTRNGANEIQKKLLVKQLRLILNRELNSVFYFHHGDCIGVDAEAHDIAEKLGFYCCVHPPEKNEVRAFKEPATHLMWDTKGYFARNRDIVDCSREMFAVPMTNFETMGGTWYTINYAKKKNKPLQIIYPEGRIEQHGEVAESGLLRRS